MDHSYFFFLQFVTGNGWVEKAEMGRFWHQFGYGNEQTGEKLFIQLDYKQTGKINEDDWRCLFHTLDCRKLYQNLCSTIYVISKNTRYLSN